MKLCRPAYFVRTTQLLPQPGHESLNLSMLWSGVFYEFEGRKYCEHDFHVLFAPCCQKCGEFIIGRVIKVREAAKK